ncbi:hypothetical protein E2C01_058541 [Portunus trituberculatus]|uniref:Uncharacterized protein n=1 Tax=Portunus trituberculatus TaxID=210409 RepID=A0A5B7H481_PORTR|nr:hypothetical protein [Portunus trituberculatus]
MSNRRSHRYRMSRRSAAQHTTPFWRAVRGTLWRGVRAAEATALGGATAHSAHRTIDQHRPSQTLPEERGTLGSPSAAGVSLGAGGRPGLREARRGLEEERSKKEEETDGEGAGRRGSITSTTTTTATITAAAAAASATTSSPSKQTERCRVAEHLQHDDNLPACHPCAVTPSRRQSSASRSRQWRGGEGQPLNG